MTIMMTTTRIVAGASRKKYNQEQVEKAYSDYGNEQGISSTCCDIDIKDKQRTLDKHGSWPTRWAATPMPSSDEEDNTKETKKQ